LDHPCHYHNNHFRLFVFAESRKQQLQIEQADEIWKKGLKDNVEIGEFISQDIWVNWVMIRKNL